jgi:hypothetical protein
MLSLPRKGAAISNPQQHTISSDDHFAQRLQTKRLTQDPERAIERAPPLDAAHSTSHEPH